MLHLVTPGYNEDTRMPSLMGEGGVASTSTTSDQATNLDANPATAQRKGSTASSGTLGNTVCCIVLRPCNVVGAVRVA